MSGNRSIITLIMRQRIHRDTSSLTRAKSLKKTAKETEQSVNHISAGVEVSKSKAIALGGEVRMIKEDVKTTQLTQEQLLLATQSQALRMITLVQMSRFLVSDIKKFGDGKDDLAELVSVMSSLIIMAYQYQSLMATNKLLAQQIAAAGIVGSIGIGLAGLHPALLIGGTLALSAMSAMNQSLSNSNANMAQLRKTSYGRITR